MPEGEVPAKSDTATDQKSIPKQISSLMPETDKVGDDLKLRILSDAKRQI
jgi:hypothetical protein